mmetsp:Transcript_35829/g.78439  ORF Transcript_35829/g.78439 Transcript_35829/m.78439 type:complete len:220 (+) Transcript_35829:853-1512(+)
MCLELSCLASRLRQLPLHVLLPQAEARTLILKLPKLQEATVIHELCQAANQGSQIQHFMLTIGTCKVRLQGGTVQVVARSKGQGSPAKFTKFLKQLSLLGNAGLFRTALFSTRLRKAPRGSRKVSSQSSKVQARVHLGLLQAVHMGALLAVPTDKRARARCFSIGPRLWSHWHGTGGASTGTNRAQLLAHGANLFAKQKVALHRLILSVLGLVSVQGSR